MPRDEDFLIGKERPAAMTFRGITDDVAIQYELFEKKGHPVYYWAEGGLVHWEDSRDNTYGTMYWQTAAERVLAVSEMVIKSGEQGHYGDERRKLQQFICDMERVIRKAKDQGGPLEKGAVQFHKDARKKLFVMPGAENAF